MSLSGRADAASEAPELVTLRATGDNGDVIATAAVSADGEELTLRDWVMEREHEAQYRLMDRVVEEAAARGCTRVRGEFRANGKNEPMREFLAQFGFTMIGADEGSTLWILPVSAYEPMG